MFPVFFASLALRKQPNRRGGTVELLVRSLSLLVFTLVVGCVATPGEPTLREVEPTVLDARRGGALELRGQGFFPAGTFDFDRPERSKLSTVVSAELIQGALHVALSDVTLVDSTRVSAQVPAGLSQGAWAVRLMTPRGVELTLEDALRLEEIADAGDPDAGDPDAGDPDGGEIDGGPQPCATQTFLDDDGDGFGVADSGSMLCGPGRSPIIGDCNDVDSLTSPAGREICNQLDDDCDGTTDEGCADAGFVRLRDAGQLDYFSASAFAPQRLWIAGGNRLLMVDGDAGEIDASNNCPNNMKAVWADPTGRAFVGGGNNGVGRLVTATRAAGCSNSQLIPEPVVGMTGFSTPDGGVRMDAVLRDGRRASWDGVGPVQVFGGKLPSGFELHDAHGSSPDAMYAVGGTTGTPQRPAVFRLQADGGFVSEALPTQNVQDGQLRGVWVVSPTEVVAVGDRGLVLRRVQGAWQHVDPPSMVDFTTVRAFSIGRFYLSTQLGDLRQWNGSWSLRYTDAVPVRDLTAFDEEHFWLVGDDEFIINGPRSP